MRILTSWNSLRSLQRVGIDDTTSFDLNIVLDSMFCIGTIISWGCESHSPSAS